MEKDLKNQQLARERAAKKVRNIKGFYNHLIIFTIVNLALLAIVFYIGFSVNYFINFFVLPWAMGIFIQWMLVFKWNPFTGKDWEKRKIEEIMKEDNN